MALEFVLLFLGHGRELVVDLSVRRGTLGVVLDDHIVMVLEDLESLGVLLLGVEMNVHVREVGGELLFLSFGLRVTFDGTESSIVEEVESDHGASSEDDSESHQDLFSLFVHFRIKIITFNQDTAYKYAMMLFKNTMMMGCLKYFR